MKQALFLGQPLELLSFQPLESNLEGFLSAVSRLIAEIARCLVMYEGMVRAGAIEREPVEVGRAAEPLNQPRERIRQTIGYRYLGLVYTELFQERIQEFEEIASVMIGDEVNLSRHR
jgi:hypothetical protein